MKISRLFLSVFCLLITMSVTSCSSGGGAGWFQTNDQQPDYNLFALFEDYPSVDEAWDGVQAEVFNNGLAELINNTPVDRLKNILGLMNNLVEAPDQAFFNTLSALQKILGEIVNQDTLDQEAGSTTYYADFCSFLESLSAANANLSSDLVPIVAKLILYINVIEDTMNDPAPVANLTNELLYMMQEQVYDNNANAQNIHYFLPLIQEAMGKLMLRNNKDMYVLNGTTTQRQDVNAIIGSDVDTGLGNTVEGLQDTIYGLNQITQNAPRAARTDLLNALVEMGRLMSKDSNGQLFKNVVQKLMVNMEDYYTVGGSKAANTDYNSPTAPGADTVSAPPLTYKYYVNSEITNTVRELWPALQLLMIRSKASTDPADKPDFSIIKDDAGVSPLQAISKSLGRLYDIGIDLSAGGLEASLTEMVEKNASGNDRAATDASCLDRLLFTLAIASNFGYKTRLSDAGEPYTNHGRGHGYSTGGAMTLNDSMYNMRSNDFMTMNAYNLALDNRLMQGYGVNRCATSFDSSAWGSHKFFLGYDYPAFLLMPPACAGDAGIPNGGDTAITPTKLTIINVKVTLVTGTSTSISSNTMTDSTKSWTVNAYAGKYVTIGSEDFAITSNTATQLTLHAAPSTSSPQSYTIVDATGVNTTGADGSQDDYRTYFPKVGNGIGETNTAAVMMGMIARICWEGEGPYYATAGAKSDTINGVAGTVYYRPDGRVYAVKNGSTLYYPADGGNDSDQNGDGWRENRYYDQINSDYFLNQVGFLTTKFCPPPLNTTNNGSNLVVGATGTDRFKMVAQDGSDPLHPVPAQQFMFWEKIHENNPDRACATQEEAMYRNYQWLVNEKKFVFTIPMWLESLGLNACSYIVIEANGLAGLSIACKGGTTTNPSDGNGVWVVRGDDGTSVLDGAELTRRGMTVNYGDSYALGDARIMVFCREDAAVSLDLIWSNILGKGHVLPDVIVQNFTPVPSMAFLYDGPTMASWKTGAASWTTSDASWSRRSKMFPLVVGAVGELHKRSYYDNSSGNNNYNYGGAHKYPIRTVLSALIPPLVKPWMRYIEDASPAPASTNWGSRWAPRIKDETTIFSYLSPSVIWDDGSNKWVATNVDLRPRFSNIKTLVNILTESGDGLHNGLLPLMSKQKVLSNILGMLQIAESTNNSGTPVVPQAAKDSLFDGLQKVITSIRGTKGDIVAKQEANPTKAYTTVSYTNLQWMFGLRYEGDVSKPIDLSLDSLLAEAIGFRDVINKVNPGDPTTWTLTTPGKGLCGFVNRRDASSDAHTYYVTNVNCPTGYHPAWDWSKFYAVMDGARSLMADDGPNGTTYYMMDSAVSLVDKMLTKVTATKPQIGGLLHTLGVLMAQYDSGSSSWVYPTDLTDIMSTNLPEIMAIFAGHYDDLMIVSYNLFKPNGFMESLLSGLKTHYPWTQVFTDLNGLLNDHFVVPPLATPKPLDRRRQPDAAHGRHVRHAGNRLVHKVDLFRSRLRHNGR